MERVLPKILRGAIDDIYQTPFRLLGNFGKKQFEKIKRKLVRLKKYLLLYILYLQRSNNKLENVR